MKRELDKISATTNGTIVVSFYEKKLFRKKKLITCVIASPQGSWNLTENKKPTQGQLGFMATELFKDEINEQANLE